MKEKLKNINLSTVNEVIFGLFTLVTMLGIYLSERNALVFLAFLVYAIYMSYCQLRELVKTHNINTNINFKRYLNEARLKEEPKQ